MAPRPKPTAPFAGRTLEAMDPYAGRHRRPSATSLLRPSLARSGPGNRLNPKSFDKHMRKPSMRFGRAGTASRTGADAFLNSGEDLDEEDEEDESDRRPPDKSNEQSRRLSVSAGGGSVRDISKIPRPSSSALANVAGSIVTATATGSRREERPPTRSSRRQIKQIGDSREAPVFGIVPSMTDAALKDLIEAALNEEQSARAPMLRTSSSQAPPPLKVALMGRVIIPSNKGTSVPTGKNRETPRVSRSRVHAVCLVMEERAHPSGSSWIGHIKDISVHPGQDGDEEKSTSVATNRNWSLKGMCGVEKREKEGSKFTLIFETGGSGTAGRESPYTWEAVSSAACDEILWGLLTMHRAMRASEALEAVNVTLKELDATAVYHGLASKHPLVPKLARQIRMDERSGNSAGGVVRELGDTGGRRGSGSGRRESDDARANVDKGRRSSKDTTRWDYEEFEQGEAVLGRLKWLEKGREGLLEELSEELDGLEGGTIQQLIAWSEKTDETETLISLLDEVDKQLELMEGWLEQHGRPLESMQVDMSAIERKNNKLDVQWRNYQNLHEYLNNLVEAISITPADEAILRTPQVVLDAALKSADDDAGPAVEKVVASTEALASALAATEKLAKHESTSSLQLLADQRGKLVGLAEVTCSQLVGFCRRLLRKLANQEGFSSSELPRTSSVLGDTSNQRLLQAQRQFHGYLIDYEPIFAQARNLEDKHRRRSMELQQAYAEDLGQGFLKVRIRAYFGDLLLRVVFQHGSPGLAQMERCSIGDTGSSPSETNSQTFTVGQLLPVLALKQCLEHTMPAVEREEAFFCTLFGLNPTKDPKARDAARRMLEVGFAELKINYKRFASEVGDNAFDTLGAIALVEQTQTRKQNQIGGSMSILLDFKALLMQRFNRFIDEQVSWIQGQRGDAKKAGILMAVAKLPTLVRKLQSATVAAVGSKTREEVGEAHKAYQNLVINLFNHIDEVAAGNPKYEHMVRLENYHFFSATIGPLKVHCLQEYVVQAQAMEETATTRYLEWLVGYQFPLLTQFFSRVEELVVTVGAADVTYHEPRRNLESTLKKHGDMKVLVEGLRATNQRMMKHVTPEGQLLGPLWDKLSDTLFAMFSRYEELCTLCYQHTLDPGAMDVKRAATEIGGGSGAPRTAGDRSPMPGDTGDMRTESPSSSTGLGLEHFGSFSSLNSPSHNHRDSGFSGTGQGHRRNNSGGLGRFNGSQISLTSDLSAGGGGEGEVWSPSGGDLSPVVRGKKYLAKRLGL